MKKKILNLFSLFVLLLSILALSACESVPELPGINLPHEHSFTNYLSDGNATCTEDGTKTAKCDKCDKTETIPDTGSKRGHTDVIDKRVEPTCTADGMTEGKHCSACNAILLLPTSIPKIDHSFTNYIPDGNATCTEDGTKTAKCNTCNNTDTKPDEGSAGHKPVIDAAVPATCTNEGLTEGCHCELCKEVIVAQKIIPISNHDYVNLECTVCKNKQIMTYAEYDALEFNSKARVETYVQACQSWWDGKVTVYAQSPDGGYYIYDMACTADDYFKLLPGTKIIVTGTKSEWQGCVEILNATFEIVEGSSSYIASALDVTHLVGSAELIDHQNKLVSFTDMTFISMEYQGGTRGKDIYLTLSKDGLEFNFTVESYLTAPDSALYQNVEKLEPGNIVSFDGFLNWSNGENLHITNLYNIKLGGYAWGTTQLYIEYTENSNKGELESGTRRYYAGYDLSFVDNIDTQIRARNAKAEQQAKVTLKYKYLPDEEGYGWGWNIGRMVSQTSVTATDSPDIYVNFVYDLTGAALKGCFANLKDTYENGNYFRFNEADYDPTSEDCFDSDAGEGYFYEYMKSLSLSPETKLYCLASNFCFDIVRAMVVIPVNVNLMNSITTFDKLPTTDSNGNGKHDVNDFYQLVWSNKWNYDALAKYSNVIYKDSGVTSGSDIDDILGFCAGTTSSLTSSALLYSSSVKFIEWNEDTKQYQYRESNPEYVAVAEALRKLFNENASGGIATISTTEANTLGYTDGDLQAIRTRFSENKILFGGAIMVGSLEDNVYQEMSDGFGIVPVPVYKDGEDYKTLVHSIARIVAISRNSKVKSQASAYLDYQSRNSSDILEDYYEFQLTAAVSGGLAGEDNKQMMIYIRNHVRDCFDKTYDDWISAYIGEDAEYQTWNHFLAEARYQLSNANNKYASFYKSKENNFKPIYESWNTWNRFE